MKKQRNSKGILACLLSAAMLAAMVPTAVLPASTESLPGMPEISRKLSQEGMVLLENNNNTLPVQQGGTVALFGANTWNYISGGTGSGEVMIPYEYDLAYGINTKEQKGKLSDYQPLALDYADTAIVSIGRVSGKLTDTFAKNYEDYPSSFQFANLQLIL